MTAEPGGRGALYLVAAAVVLGLVGLGLALVQSPWAPAPPAAGLICVAASLALRGRG